MTRYFVMATYLLIMAFIWFKIIIYDMDYYIYTKHETAYDRIHIILQLIIIVCIGGIIWNFKLPNFKPQIIETTIENHYNDTEINQKLEELNRRVEYNEQIIKQLENDLYNITHLPNIPIQDSTDRISYTEEELTHLLSLVQHEAGAESYECKLWVASVIVNRVLDERYPNTLWDVIYQTEPTTQFTPVVKGLYKEPDGKTHKAVYEALKQDYSEGSWMFNNELLTDDDVQSWFDQFTEVATIDDVTFRR